MLEKRKTCDLRVRGIPVNDGEDQFLVDAPVAAHKYSAMNNF